MNKKIPTINSIKQLFEEQLTISDNRGKLINLLNTSKRTPTMQNKMTIGYLRTAPLFVFKDAGKKYIILNTFANSLNIPELLFYIDMSDYKLKSIPIPSDHSIKASYGSGVHSFGVYISGLKTLLLGLGDNVIAPYILSVNFGITPPQASLIEIPDLSGYQSFFKENCDFTNMTIPNSVDDNPIIDVAGPSTIRVPRRQVNGQPALFITTRSSILLHTTTTGYVPETASIGQLIKKGSLRSYWYCTGANGVYHAEINSNGIRKELYTPFGSDTDMPLTWGADDITCASAKNIQVGTNKYLMTAPKAQIDNCCAVIDISDAENPVVRRYPMTIPQPPLTEYTTIRLMKVEKVNPVTDNVYVLCWEAEHQGIVTQAGVETTYSRIYEVIRYGQDEHTYTISGYTNKNHRLDTFILSANKRVYVGASCDNSFKPVRENYKKIIYEHPYLQNFNWETGTISQGLGPFGIKIAGHKSITTKGNMTLLWENETCSIHSAQEGYTIFNKINNSFNPVKYKYNEHFYNPEKPLNWNSVKSVFENDTYIYLIAESRVERSVYQWITAPIIIDKPKYQVFLNIETHRYIARIKKSNIYEKPVVKKHMIYSHKPTTIYNTQHNISRHYVVDETANNVAGMLNNGDYFLFVTQSISPQNEPPGMSLPPIHPFRDISLTKRAAVQVYDFSLNKIVQEIPIGDNNTACEYSYYPPSNDIGEFGILVPYKKRISTRGTAYINSRADIYTVEEVPVLQQTSSKKIRLFFMGEPLED